MTFVNFARKKNLKSFKFLVEFYKIQPFLAVFKFNLFLKNLGIWSELY